eukprot:11197889-Lingulodinium_polyedra.AAC.1
MFVRPPKAYFSGVGTLRKLRRFVYGFKTSPTDWQYDLQTCCAVLLGAGDASLSGTCTIGNAKESA